MKKTKVNHDEIFNELAGKSAYFAKPERIERPIETGVPNAPTERVSDPQGVTGLVAELKQPPDASESTTRASFEFYPSELMRLRNVRSEYIKKTGRDISLSRIAREAVNNYLDRLEEAINAQTD